MCCVLGDEEVDEQIRLRDDVIYQQKQQMAIQQQRIADLEYRSKEFEELSPISIEEAAEVPTTASACLFCVAM